LTYSIAYGIAIGFIAFVITKALSGKIEALNLGSVGIAIVSVLFFVLS
jgi:xanthine/uracil/vitamin C permease (AzgA family)